MKKSSKKIIDIDKISKETKYSPIIVYDIIKELKKDGLVIKNE